MQATHGHWEAKLSRKDRIRTTHQRYLFPEPNHAVASSTKPDKIVELMSVQTFRRQFVGMRFSIGSVHQNSLPSRDTRSEILDMKSLELLIRYLQRKKPTNQQLPNCHVFDRERGWVRPIFSASKCTRMDGFR